MPTNVKQLNALVGQCIDTTANWINENPLIPNGIICLELLSDSTIKVKIGNGVSRWNELGYFPDNVSVGQATELVAGIVKKATDAEAIAGIENTKYITAAQLRSLLPLFATTQHVLIGTDNESIISPFTHKNFHDVDGNKLVPVTDITSNRKVLTAGENAGEFDWELAPLSNIENLNTNYTIQLSDRNKVFRVTGNRTINILSASSAGNGFFFSIVNAGTENITLDPSGVETIDSEETLVLQPGDSSFFIGDGTSWTTLGKSSLREVPWSIIQDIPSNFTPSSHKSTHSVGGTDVLSPSDIGAADQEHTHTLESLNASASNHTHTPVSLGAADRVHTHTPSEVGLGELPNSKSDSTDLNSSDTLATSMAVKTANDNALLAQAIANTKANSEHNHTPEEIGAAPIDGENKIPVSYIPNLDASKIVTGTIDIDRLPPSVIERVVLVQNDVDRFNLSVETVQAGDTIKVLSSGIMYLIIDDTKLNTSEGYLEYSAGSAASVPWTGVTNKPNSYNPSTHKNTHASGGSDALSPADIGASPEGHLHTLSSLGAAADIHTHTPTEVGLSNIPNSKSDSISLDSSTSLATSKAVKTAYDTAVSAENLANTKAESVHTHIPSEVGLGNLPNNKSDSINLDSSDTLATSKAVKSVNDAVIIAQTTANSKASTDLATALNPGLLSPEEKIKLAYVEENANNYTHPVNHPPSIITQDSSNRFVTDTQITNWGTAHTHSQSAHAPSNAQANADITKAEIEAKLTGTITSHAHNLADLTEKNFASLANKPTTLSGYGITDAAPSSHVGTTGAAHGVATTLVHGFMSSTDKSKLDGIVVNANNYTHPNHTGDVTSSGDGATTIVNGAVTNTKMANMAASTIKGREATTGAPQDLTAAQVRTILNIADGANNYTHPVNHAPSIITQDANNRFVTDTQISTWNGKQNALGFTPENIANKNAVNGYAGLDANGKILESVIPSLALMDVYESVSEAAMLALSNARSGDICIRTDINKTFILAVDGYSTLANWKELRTPTDSVQSVAGKTGVVTLVKGDVGLGNVDNTSDLNKPISTATQTALDGKVSTTRTVNGQALSSDITLTTAHIADSSNKRYVTDAQLTVIGNTSGTNTGDETATTLGSKINGATAKTTPVDADLIPLADSAASFIMRKLTWANLKATLKTYFDTLYNLYVHPTSGVSASTYRSVTVNAEGHVTAGSNPTTLSGYGITDAAPSSHVGATGAAHGSVTTSVNGFMIAADKTKLDGIATGANNYTHPANHPPSIITQDSSNRFVTDTQITNWGTAHTHSQATHAPVDAQKNSDITKAEIEAKLTGTITTHSHSTFSGDLLNVNDTVQILGNRSGAVAINLANGNVITFTPTAAVTLSFTGLTSGKSRTFMLKITNGGAFTITFPSNTVWESGSAPTLKSTGLDILVCNTTDGGNTIHTSIW